MVYKPEPVKMGLTIRISPDRNKHGNGAVGGGRKKNTGKKAVISAEGEKDVTITDNTTTNLLQKVRVQFKIPTNITINRKGETRI